MSDDTGCICAYSMGSVHLLEGTMNAESEIKVFVQHMLPSRRCVFQGRPCVFQQDNAKPHTASLQLHAVQIFHLQRTFGLSFNEKYGSLEKKRKTLIEKRP